MNLNNGTTPPRRQRRTQKNGKGHPIAFSLLALLGVTLATFKTINMTNEYSGQIAALEARENQVNSRIEQLESEIEYLTIQQESLSEKHIISQKIAEFKLGLRPHEPHQVRELSKPTAHVQYARSRTLSRTSVAVVRR